MTVIVTKPGINVREELSSLKKPVGLVGARVMAAETPSEFYSAVGTRKNLLINGNFEVWQRGTSFGNSPMYTADRWFSYSNPSGSGIDRVAFSVGHDTIPGSPRYYYQNSITTEGVAGDRYAWGQRIEDWQRLLGRTLTLSGWYRLTAGLAGHGLQVNVRQSSTSYDVSNSQTFYNFERTNTWKFFSVTFTIPYNAMGTATSTAALELTYYYQQVLTAGVFNLANVQLELGPVATPFEHRSYAEELQLCQRYYERVTAVSNTAWMTGYGFGQTLYFYLPWQTTKRANDGTATYSAASLNDVLNVYGTGSSSADVAGLYSSFATGSAHSHGLSFYMSLTASTYTPRGTALLWGIKNGQWIASESEL